MSTAVNTSIVPMNSNPSDALSRAQTTAITSKTGKVTGHRTQFSNSTAKQLRESFKAKGIKGKELTKSVNSVLSGEQDVRTVIGQAYVAMLIQDGYLPDVADKK